METKRLIALIGGIVLVLVALGIIIGLSTRQKPVATPEALAPAEIQKKELTETKRLLAMDVSDPSHVGNVKYIQAGLERYYADKQMYPKKMEDLVPLYLRVLPKYSTEKHYLYAHYPKDKPKSYHIGTPLGGRNPSDAKAFAEDADFNSEKQGYAGGFDGADPVYDAVSFVKK